MTNKIVHIKHTVEKTTLSKAQKKFNGLIKKIEVQKQILQEWQDTTPKYQQRYHAEYEPLFESYNECRVQLVHLLDEAHGDKFFKKTDKAKLRNLICDMAADLIREGLEELKEIYNRYCDTDFDTEKEEEDAYIGDAMKSMMEELFGVEFDENADFSSPEKIRDALQQKMQAEQERLQYHEVTRTKRKKTAKQLEKEAREKEAEQNASKSIQEVFRKLVAVLHPDREPDETERERKTKLMQRVNAAYTKKDLLQLLALQLEIEQIDQTQLNTIAEDQLKHFNKILQEQLDELEQEISEVELPFRMQLNVPPYLNLQPAQVLKSLSNEIREMQSTIKHAKSELKEFQNFSNLKEALKTYRL
jgi:hypothetical protein